MLFYLILIASIYGIYLFFEWLQNVALEKKRYSLLKRLENKDGEASEIINKLKLSLLIEYKKSVSKIDINEAFKKIDLTRGRYRIGKVFIDNLYQIEDKEIIMIGTMVDRDFDFLLDPVFKIPLLNQADIPLDRTRFDSMIFRLTFDGLQKSYRLYTTSNIKFDSNMNNNLNEFSRYLFLYLQNGKE